MERGRSSGDLGHVKLATASRAMRLSELVGSGSGSGQWSWGMAIQGVQSPGARYPGGPQQQGFDIHGFAERLGLAGVWEGSRTFTESRFRIECESAGKSVSTQPEVVSTLVTLPREPILPV
ncbi:hypothetical protein Taro_002770 [Colocasia esculenta]|uniref:Uncharacterized protein n=1 Tax=Colocasia esculenta TaxID=4460 RepID=A0A843TLS7_COLES|nr:hypothetical protein [Colocasia esculenta]